MTRFDEWLRRRMRQIAWKQWKTPRNRYAKIYMLEGFQNTGPSVQVGQALGPWRMSKSPPVHHALNNAPIGMNSD